MTPLLVATTNEGKVREIRHILASAHVPFRPVSLRDLGHFTAVPETGDTFAANALQKATGYLELTGLASLADDSGLVVPALGGAPGVFSARYAGEGASDAANNAKLSHDMATLTGAGRAAYFECAMAVALPGAAPWTRTARVHGVIIHEPRGSHGFGYDPLFQLATGQTSAEVPPAYKSLVSHRGRALRLILRDLSAMTSPGTHHEAF